jgi:hypothetical protein
MAEVILNDTEFTNSKITKCLIKKDKCLIKEEDKIISTATKYRSILIDIWRHMRKYMSIKDIQKKSTFRFGTINDNGVKGYRWYDDIQMSFQARNANQTVKEIIKMVKFNKLTIKLWIKLSRGKEIYFELIDGVAKRTDV